MIKYLNGIPLDTKRRIMDIKTYKEIEHAVETAKLSKIVIELNKPDNIDTANDVFMKCLNDRAFDFRSDAIRAVLNGKNKLNTIIVGKTRLLDQGQKKKSRSPNKNKTKSKTKLNQKQGEYKIKYQFISI